MLSAKYTSTAESELVSVAIYLQSHNAEAAIRFLDAFDKTVEFLKRSPLIGEVCPYPNPLFEGTRVWRIRGFKSYLVFYRVLPDELEIVRVLHGSRDLGVLFGDADT
jgi:toxin ParE1/3/4